MFSSHSSALFFDYQALRKLAEVNPISISTQISGSTTSKGRKAFYDYFCQLMAEAPDDLSDEQLFDFLQKFRNVCSDGKNTATKSSTFFPFIEMINNIIGPHLLGKVIRLERNGGFTLDAFKEMIVATQRDLDHFHKLSERFFAHRVEAFLTSYYEDEERTRIIRTLDTIFNNISQLKLIQQGGFPLNFVIKLGWQEEKFTGKLYTFLTTLFTNLQKLQFKTQTLSDLEIINKVCADLKSLINKAQKLTIAAPLANRYLAKISGWECYYSLSRYRRSHPDQQEMLMRELISQLELYGINSDVRLPLGVRVIIGSTTSSAKSAGATAAVPTATTAARPAAHLPAMGTATTTMSAAATAATVIPVATTAATAGVSTATTTMPAASKAAITAVPTATTAASSATFTSTKMAATSTMVTSIGDAGAQVVVELQKLSARGVMAPTGTTPPSVKAAAASAATAAVQIATTAASVAIPPAIVAATTVSLTADAGAQGEVELQKLPAHGLMAAIDATPPPTKAATTTTTAATPESDKTPIATVAAITDTAVHARMISGASSIAIATTAAALFTQEAKTSTAASPILTSNYLKTDGTNGQMGETAVNTESKAPKTGALVELTLRR